MLGKIVVVALVALIGTSWFSGSTGLASAQNREVYQSAPFCPNEWIRWESVPHLNFNGWRCYENTQFQTCSDGYLLWKEIPGQYYNYYNWVCFQKPADTQTSRNIDIDPNSPLCPNDRIRWEFVPQLNFNGWRCYENTQIPTCPEGYLLWQQIPDQYDYDWVCDIPPTKTHSEGKTDNGYSRSDKVTSGKRYTKRTNYRPYR